ncbi:methylenetetrahydrofolate dehydrogenase (NADP+)/methenyltetrahydrofolate cyclohydrolase [Litorimonas taeanensis]|uniref:Bifunctional protein FolD n=1 Tax=Litorimonas taeanensis TaxID=568099 RepID=A0A420WMJ0_9PROT|nr:bifunctional methylenetetrahydrofolate dehydrogenase/methenyltetrahydrofolate cyclohydrolase FolD [Litorimonas taeanensis]RKQ72132.1 methylenetetrahydrofolate dehydrogenase (NADP+)/methenyltetrahydrofolate cyclohydrolase [Litorimonas taeanensis]
MAVQTPSSNQIDGKKIAEELRARVGSAVKSLPQHPTLAVVLVGDDPASQVYVRSKIKFTQECGMRSVERRLPENASQDEVVATVRALNEDTEIDGILVQLPLPKGLDSDAVIEEIDPSKDVDGLTETSAGRLLLGKTGLRPCTPTGCVILAKAALGDLTGKNCVVLGRSILVGKPAALLFLEQNCTVTIAHSRTKDLAAICREADILVPAVGRAEMVQSDWIKEGACVIDVGINRVPNPAKPGKTKLVGDVDFPSAEKVAGAITPVPGGVGPMTIACLLRNTVLAACHRRGWETPDIIASL